MSLTARSITKAEAVLEQIVKHLEDEQRSYFTPETTLFEVGKYQHAKELLSYIKHWSANV